MALPWRGGWSKESRRRPARPAKNAMGSRCKPTNRQTTASSAESRRSGSMKGLSDVMDASGSTNGLSGACQTEMEEYAQRVAVHQNRSWGALRQTVQGTVLRSGWSAVNFDEREKPALTLQIPTTQEARGINGHLILQCGCGTDGNTRTRGKAIETSCARLQFPSPIFLLQERSPFARFPDSSRDFYNPPIRCHNVGDFAFATDNPPILDTGSSSVASSRSGANIGNETVARTPCS